MELVLENGAVPQGAPAAAPAPAEELPPGLTAALELTSPIDSAVAAQGDPFTARLAKPIVDGREREIAPAGAVVRGRLIWVSGPIAGPPVGPRTQPRSLPSAGFRAQRRAQRQCDLAFGRKHRDRRPRAPLSGDQQNQHVANLRQMKTRFASRGIPMDSALLHGGGTGSYLFPGNRKILEPGFRMEWETGVP